MRRSDRTSMGGIKSKFQTTNWDEIRNAGTQNEDRQREIISRLIAGYWKPVYCYLVRKGYDDELAKDLTQDFFHEIVLGRCLIQKADEAKGRFRTFLLSALHNYIIDHDHRTRARPRLISLEGLSAVFPSQEMKPDEAFTYTWVSVLLDNVIANVEQECYEDGKENHWKLFYKRVLKPIMYDVKPPPLAKICRKLGIESEKNKASNMIVTVKRRFRRVLEDYLQQHSEPDSDVESELSKLVEILSKGGAR